MQNDERGHATMRDNLSTAMATFQQNMARRDIEAVRHEIEIAVRNMTIRTGIMLIMLFGALVAIKYFG